MYSKLNQRWREIESEVRGDHLSILLNFMAAMLHSIAKNEDMERAAESEECCESHESGSNSTC